MGGVAARKTLVDQIRYEEKNVLLLDAGDYFQGTPYFNLFRGEVEMKAMEQLGYDAAAIGNHDFDAGLDRFAEIAGTGGFPILCANYDFNDTPFKGKSKPWHIFKRSHMKIGVFGLGVQLEGLVAKAMFAETRFQNPIKKANEVAAILKEEEKCHLVICLSHLGFTSRFPGQPNDEILAKNTENIDLIIGGHSHHFLDSPVNFLNKVLKPVPVCQVGHSGVKLGKVQFSLETEGGAKKRMKGTALSVS